jgi:hypothetical protein
MMKANSETGIISELPGPPSMLYLMPFMTHACHLLQKIRWSLKCAEGFKLFTKACKRKATSGLSIAATISLRVNT